MHYMSLELYQALGQGKMACCIPLQGNVRTEAVFRCQAPVLDNLGLLTIRVHISHACHACVDLIAWSHIVLS